MKKIIKGQDGYAPLAGGAYFRELRGRLRERWDLVEEGPNFYELREVKTKNKRVGVQSKGLAKVLAFRVYAGDSRFSTIVFEIFDKKYEQKVEMLEL